MGCDVDLYTDRPDAVGTWSPPEFRRSPRQTGLFLIPPEPAQVNSGHVLPVGQLGCAALTPVPCKASQMPALRGDVARQQSQVSGPIPFTRKVHQARPALHGQFAAHAPHTRRAPSELRRPPETGSPP